MSKICCLDRFYDLLDELENNIGGRRRLGDCHGRMNWPKRGVYFFFEPGETRNVKSSSSRVVRVGASTRLWTRISYHRGTLNPYGGYHRRSTFRRLVGNAIGKRNPKLMPESWKQEGYIPPEIRELELPHEVRVSKYLAKMTLLFVCVPDASESNSMMEDIERESIALLSGYREPSPDKPSSNWLGLQSTQEVQRSGLWNSKHVKGGYSQAFLDDFEELIRDM